MIRLSHLPCSAGVSTWPRLADARRASPGGLPAMIKVRCAPGCRPGPTPARRRPGQRTGTREASSAVHRGPDLGRLPFLPAKARRATVALFGAARHPRLALTPHRWRGHLAASVGAARGPLDPMWPRERPSLTLHGSRTGWYGGTRVLVERPRAQRRSRRLPRPELALPGRRRPTSSSAWQVTIGDPAQTPPCSARASNWDEATAPAWRAFSVESPDAARRRRATTRQRRRRGWTWPTPPPARPRLTCGGTDSSPPRGRGCRCGAPDHAGD